MKKLYPLIFLFLLLGGLQVNAQQKPGLSWKDVGKWRSIKPGSNVLSPDGQWMAYVTGPVEGDQEVVVKKAGDTTIYRYPCGATATPVTFSNDARFVAFKVSAKDADVKAAKKTNKTLYDKLVIVSLSGNTKTEFEKVKNYSFSGKTAGWIAIQFAAAENAPKDKDAPKGTDLLLYNLNSQKSYNVGSVSEFAFNKQGNLLAYTIDANGQNGNGILLRDLHTGITTALDNDKAVYKSLNWTENGDALAVLKAVKNDHYKDDVYTVIGFKKFNGDATDKTVYSSLDDKSLPAGMGISGDQRPYWSEDLTILFFGSHKLEKKEEKAKADSTKKGGKDKAAATPNKDDIEKPDMIIWNWQDRRLQSAQQVTESRDKAFSYLCGYHVAGKHAMQYADSNMRTVMVCPKQAYALGIDESKYELMSNLNGQSYADVYVIDLHNGSKKQLFNNFYETGNRGFSVAPNGKLASYYQDGVYYAVNLETGEKYNLTGKIKSSFVDNLDDHNVKKVATPNLGWSADSKYAIIRDNNDLWKISADGRSAVSLTDNWRNRQMEVDRIFRLYPDDKGTDLKKPQYFAIFDYSSKKAGFGRLDPGKNSISILFMDDHAYSNMLKADNAAIYAFSKESNEQSPEFFVTSAADLSNSVQVTKNTPDQDKYAWTSGVKLIKYVSANGDTLQAALYLPANYQPGKAYPTITYIYERLTDQLNTYTMPAFPGGGFNKAVYTSNGYAVLMPDIKYKLNDPGMSTVACVVPAVKAAVATGIVDEKRVAIHGHSWGGYQTSFLITQTDIFRAAAAGAPLTDMISMYSLIYWNSGGTNQAIFEASQGRLEPGYWDNLDAFTRNSPVYHIKNVHTPLLLLHNNKDGAVDFTQGIEYYNGLRRLNKPVVMITYNGENHGIAKLPNRKDYAVRMMEYFDYWLKDKPAPEWWSKGVDHIDMDKYLEARAFNQQ